MITNDVVFVNGDDWYGIYVNGCLESEGHNIDGDDMGDFLEEHQPFKYSSKWCKQEWLDTLGSFPSNIEEVVFE
jgi:hypothetical protein